MIDPVTMNAANPKDDENGNLMLERMNVHHAPLYAWGHGHITIEKAKAVLDIGCGGGANLRRLMERSPRGMVTGVDYSTVSVEKSRKVNGKAVAEGRCKVVEASVADLPFADETFTMATAFETIYFWPEIEKSFAEVLRILKPGGKNEIIAKKNYLCVIS